jgi:hypothetical protein
VQSNGPPAPIKSTIPAPAFLAMAGVLFALGANNLSLGAKHSGEELAPLYWLTCAACFAVAAISLVAFFMKRKA